MLNLILTTMSEVIKHESENVQPTVDLAGQVGNQAQTVKDIVGEAVKQSTEEEQQRERLRQVLRMTRIRTDTEVPPEEYALEVEGKGIFARRDIHAIKAKQKAGKTTALKVCMAALLRGEVFRVKSLLERPRIVYFDTEQSRTDTKLILEDVARLTGLGPEVIDSQVALYSLRGVRGLVQRRVGVEAAHPRHAETQRRLQLRHCLRAPHQQGRRGSQHARSSRHDAGSEGVYGAGVQKGAGEQCHHRLVF